MHTLLSLGYRFPDDVRIVGIDDVHYASLLPVPLTTLRQPCRDIGDRGDGGDARACHSPGACRPATSFSRRRSIVRQSCGADGSASEKPVGNLVPEPP